MIGGTDIVIPYENRPGALNACLHLIQQFWPNAVLEDAVTGERIESHELMSSDDVRELLFYRDESVAHDWETKGADPSLENTMLHMLVNPDAVTLVVDDPGESSISSLIASIRNVLRSDAPSLAVETASGAR